MTMSSSRPYMIRALYEWIVDNQCTPYILVSAYSDGVQVPQEHVNKDGQVVLNIAPSAVSDLSMDAAAVSFSARFGGVPTNIYVPCSGVLGIYARENSKGMIFEVEAEPQPPLPPTTPDKPAKRPSLKVIK